MRHIIFLFLFLFTIKLSAQKAYLINVEDRNKAIELTNTAIACIKEKKQAKAISFLLESISIDSTYRASYINLYQAALLNKQSFDQVLTFLNKGKKIFHDDDEFYFYCGEIYRFYSNLEMAIQEYTQATKYAKVNGEDYYLVPYHYFNLGNCFLTKKDFLKALENYKYAIKLNPDFAAAYVNKGTCLKMLGKNEEACKDWETAVQKGSMQAKKYLEKYCTK